MSGKKNSEFFQWKSGALIALIAFGLLMFGPGGISSTLAADYAENTAELVQEAKEMLDSFHADPELAWFHEHVQEAKAVFVIPSYKKAGLVLGAGGGNGVLMVQDQHDYSWSQPAFYTVGGIDVGLQIGVQVLENVIMVMTQEGMDQFYESRFKMGGTASVALGPKGGGQAGTPKGDLLSFSRSKGAMVSLALGGATVAVHKDYNEAFYGAGTAPESILKKRGGLDPRSAALRGAVKQVGYKHTQEFFPVR